MTPHAGLTPDARRDVVEVAVQFDDLVATAPGTIDLFRLVGGERRPGSKSPHRVVQALDASRDQRLQAYPETDDRQEDRDRSDAELSQQTLPVDGLREAEIVNEQ